MAIKEYVVVGQVTGKIYAMGTKRDCLRKLHKEYPSTVLNGWNKSARPVAKVFTEPIVFKEVR